MVNNVSGVPRFTVVSTQREGGDVRPVIVRSREEDAAKTKFTFRPPVPSVTSDISIRGRALSLASGSSNSVYDKSKLFEAISKAIVARGPPIGAPPAPIYALAASNSSVNEGASTNFVLTTANLASGSQVAYTLSGVSAADVQGGSLTGTATIGADGRATITVGLLADTLTEGTETLSVAVGSASASTSVNDTSLSLPTYALAASSASVNEGASTNFVLTTANVASGSQVAYTLSGVSAADVQGDSLTGTATIGSDGRATITVGLLADTLTEGTETLSVAAGGTSASTSVSDTSLTPPTYALAASSASVNEGASTNFVLTTANLASGSQVAYTLSGVSAADVQGGSLTGTATIGSDGRATITVGLLADNLTEGAETLSLAAGGASASTSVNDTSLTPPSVLTMRGATYRNDVWRLAFTGGLNKTIQYTVVGDDEVGSNVENVRNKVRTLIQNDADLGPLFNIAIGGSGTATPSITLTPNTSQIINLTLSVVDASNADLSSSNPLLFTLS